MRSPSSCRLCNAPIVVESASGLCATCLRSADTQEKPLSISLGSLLLGSEQPDASLLVDATATAQPAVETPTHVVRTSRHDAFPPAPAGYDMLRRLGGGGMGEVFLTHEYTTGRTVAMKFLRAGGKTGLERFYREVQAQSKLDHPNIIRILATDFLRVDPYFTMEVAEGGSLSKWIEKHGPLEPTEAACLVATVARAVDVAHANDIIHRDLKPSNILLAVGGGQWAVGDSENADLASPSTAQRPLSTFTPKVSDFGLAKALDTDDGVTVGSGPLGTPGFMPPEQVSKQNGELSPASDVYALGATLFYMLTGIPPFGPGDNAEVMYRVLTDPTPRPRSTRPTVPAELDGIVFKCLEKEPADRYATASALADDLERFLVGGKPVAPMQTRWRRAKRWASRNRRRLATVGLIVLVAGLIAAYPPSWKQSTAGPTPVELADEIRTPDGRLLPFKIRYGGERAKVTADADGTITVSSFGLCLVEYTPGPGDTPYRFRASIRHQRSEVSGRVGIYFLHRTLPGAAGEGHQFGRMIYNDLWSPAEVAKTVAQIPPVPLPVPLENQVQIHFTTRVAGGSPPFFKDVDLATGAPFRMCGNRANCWRVLEVVVTPEGVTGTRDGQFVGSVSADQVTTAFTDGLRQARKKHPEDVPLATLRGQYAVRGGVGFVIEGSSASFRQVELSPTGKAD